MKLLNLLVIFVLLFGLLGVVSAQEGDSPLGETDEVLRDDG